MCRDILRTEEGSPQILGDIQGDSYHDRADVDVNQPRQVQHIQGDPPQ